jgi:hypothetical protein
MEGYSGGSSFCKFTRFDSTAHTHTDGTLCRQSIQNVQHYGKLNGKLNHAGSGLPSINNTVADVRQATDGERF